MNQKSGFVPSITFENYRLVRPVSRTLEHDNDATSENIASCWRLYVSPRNRAPKRPILSCITFRKCAILAATRREKLVPCSSIEITIVVYEPPLLSGCFIDSMLIRAPSPLSLCWCGLQQVNARFACDLMDTCVLRRCTRFCTILCTSGEIFGEGW